MAHGLVAIGLDRAAAAIALRRGCALNALADFALGYQRPKAAFVAGLPSQAFAALGPWSTRRCLWAIAGRGLGGVA